MLIIDDDPSIRSYVQLVLSRLHAGSTAVSSADAGLRQLQTETWDALFLDLGLPDLAGEEICAHLRNADASLPIVLMSGQHDRLLWAKRPIDGVLRKPFTPGELEAALSRALAIRAISSQRLTRDPAEVRPFEVTGRPE